MRNGQRTIALSVGIGPKNCEAQYSIPNEREIGAWAVRGPSPNLNNGHVMVTS